MKKKLYCCERCRLYWTCETKWYRGERGEENICCPLCNFFAICVESSESLNKNFKKVRK